MFSISFSITYLSLACSTPQKQAPVNPVNQVTASEVQNTEQEINQSIQAKSPSDCVQECLDQRQMESRAIEAIEADCEKSCDENSTTPTLELNSQEILEPQTTEELQQAIDKMVRVTGTLEVNEFGVFLMTEQMGKILLQSPDISNLKESGAALVEIMGTYKNVNDSLRIDVTNYEKVK
jgi:hypothetical protein